MFERIVQLGMKEKEEGGRMRESKGKEEAEKKRLRKQHRQMQPMRTNLTLGH